MSDEQQEDRPFVVEVGPLKIDVARSVGYFGGLALAVALELVAPELALVIAAVPLVKLLKRRNATMAERAIASVIEGAAKPIGGDAEATVRPKWIDEENEDEQAPPTRAARSTPRLH
jgi:hypothetical protein